MMTKKVVYLANPYGFSPTTRDLLVPVISRLERLGLEVWEPFAKVDEIVGPGPCDAGWALSVGALDVSAVKRSDAVFAIVNGCPPDEGVCVELGIAIAMGIPTFLYRDDFRRCADSDHYPLNLMLFTGMPSGIEGPDFLGWRDFYHTGLDDITNASKALARWSRGELVLRKDERT